MDQSLKARLIGATVLVILAVVLIPELLSGRKAATTSGQETATNERRTFTIDIGKSGDAMTAPESARPQPLPPPVEASGPATPAPDRGPGAVAREAMDTQVPRADPGAVEQRGRVAAPPDSAPAAAEGPTKGSAAAATPAPPAATQPPTAPGAAGRGGYFIQVGAFSSAESARKLMAQLEADGYSVRVAPITRGGKTLHRVRVGPADSRAAAQQLADRLKARGLPAALVPSE
jgi:cell division septation protein DedD